MTTSAGAIPGPPFQDDLVMETDPCDQCNDHGCEQCEEQPPRHLTSLATTKLAKEIHDGNYNLSRAPQQEAEEMLTFLDKQRAVDNPPTDYSIAQSQVAQELLRDVASGAPWSSYETVSDNCKEILLRVAKEIEAQRAVDQVNSTQATSSSEAFQTQVTHTSYPISLSTEEAFQVLARQNQATERKPSDTQLLPHLPVYRRSIPTASQN